MAHAKAWSMARGNHELVKILKGEVYEFMVKEDILWQQRSRVEWLKSGDFNMSYFHSHATQRNRRNFISKLVLDDGSSVEGDQKNGETMVNYFRNIFTSATSSNFNQIL